MLSHLKSPPHSVEAEHGVLGSIILDNSLLDEICTILTKNDFFLQVSKEVWSQMLFIREKGAVIDVLSITEGSGIPLVDVAEIVQNTPSKANAFHYVQRVKDCSLNRQLIKAGFEIQELGFHWETFDQKITKAQELLQFDNGKIEKKDINSVLKNVIDELDQKYHNQGEIIGLETGIKKLDSRLNGVKSTDLWIIAARPSMGKTTFAMNIAEYNAMVKQKPVLVFSLEMGAEELIKRSICNLGSMEQNALDRGQMQPGDWDRLSYAVSKLRDAPIFIEDKYNTSIDKICSTVRKYKHQHPDLACVVIDYLQLIEGAGNTKNDEVSANSRALKKLAMTLETPVVLLSQLNRECEKRPNKRPKLSDLRDSGAIEQDGDIITFLYRDEVYDENTQDKGVCELITRKFKKGQIGTDYIAAQLQFSRFRDLHTNQEG